MWQTIWFIIRSTIISSAPIGYAALGGVFN